MNLREGYTLLGGDLRSTLRRLGDRALLMKHLRQFAHDGTLATLQTAVAAQDEAGVWHAAHTLRGTCLTLGLDKLATAAGRLMAAPDWSGRESALALLTLEHEHTAAVIAMLRESELALSMFLHELRTPLQTILGVAASRPDADGMPRVALAARHLSLLMSGAEEPAAEAFSLPEVLRDAAALLQGSCRVSIQTALPHERVLGEPTRLTQVLLNLLTNAARHAPESDIIALDATETDKEIILTVRDQGPGMSEAERQRAFEPYWQARGGAGRGLGLTIARRLTERMGGSLIIDSAPGEGTTATVCLPLMLSDAVGEDAETVEKPRTFDGLRALLAEDDRVSAEVSAELLMELGLRTSVVHDGGEAVRLARDGGYDCVFIDAHMPGLGAVEAVASIRGALPGAPVFALTGGVPREEELRLREAGLRECLLKPVTAEALSRLLGRYFPDR